MTEDTLIRSRSLPLWPDNPNGETHPDKIDWGSDEVKNLNINWDKIEFLIATVRDDGSTVIHRHPKVPQFGGLGAILAYQANLCRFMQDKVGGGDEFIEFVVEKGILFDLAMTLSRGGEIPIN